LLISLHSAFTLASLFRIRPIRRKTGPKKDRSEREREKERE
jgi:hypothetical protein